MKIFPKEMEFFQKIRPQLEMKVVEEVLEDRDPFPGILGRRFPPIRAGRRSGQNALRRFTNFGAHYSNPVAGSLLTAHYDVPISRKTLEQVEEDRKKVLDMLEKISPKEKEWGQSTREFTPGDIVEVHPSLKGHCPSPAEVVRIKFRDVLIRPKGFKKTVAVLPRHIRKTKEDVPEAK